MNEEDLTNYFIIQNLRSLDTTMGVEEDLSNLSVNENPELENLEFFKDMFDAVAAPVRASGRFFN